MNGLLSKWNEDDAWVLYQAINIVREIDKDYISES